MLFKNRRRAQSAFVLAKEKRVTGKPTIAFVALKPRQDAFLVAVPSVRQAQSPVSTQVPTIPVTVSHVSRRVAADIKLIHRQRSSMPKAAPRQTVPFPRRRPTTIDGSFVPGGSNPLTAG